MQCSYEFLYKFHKALQRGSHDSIIIVKDIHD